MARSGGQRLGILAVSFDAMGRNILSALVERPGVPYAYLQCCHVAEEPEGEESRISWTCWTPEAQWSPPAWAPADGGFEAGLEGAVRSMLNVERWLTPGGGLDLLDLVLIQPGPEPASGTLPAGVPEALQRLRRRFKRIGRVLLLVDGTFESPTESTLPGLIRPLPYWDNGVRGPFDFIILLDQINIEGMAASGAADTNRRAAGLLYHLTVGEMSSVLFSRIQAEQGRLGAPGRYLTLGFEEWRLTSELGIEATSGILYRGMTERLLNSLAVLREEIPDPADPWLEEIGPEILEKLQKTEEKEESEEAPRAWSARTGDFPAEDYAARLVQLEDRSQESLRAALRGTGWRLDALEPLLKRRISELKRLEALTALTLGNFMDDTFARWYAERWAGRLQRGEAAPVSLSEQITEPARERVIAFAGVFLAGLIASGFAWFSQNKLIPSVLAGAFGVGAFVILSMGFSRKITVTRPLPPPPPPPDRRAELNFRRGRSYIARQLVRRYENALENWNATKAKLQAELAVPLDSVPVHFPFSPEVTTALLAEKSVTPSEALHRFWETESAALRAALGRSDAKLPDLLRDFARKSCRLLADLGWSDIFRVADGGGSLGTSSWRDSLEKARSGALPWLPVPGLSIQTFLAIPRGLSADLRSTLTQQFPDQKAVEEIDGEAILVFQLSQGYRQPER